MKLHISQPEELKLSVLNLVNYYDTFCLHDSCNPGSKLNWIAGVGISQTCSAQYNFLNELSNFFLANQGKYLFGHLNYDLKNEIENLNSSKSNEISFAEFKFFVPEVTLIARKNELEIICDPGASDFSKSWVKQLSEGKKIDDIFEKDQEVFTSKKVELKARTSKEKYISHCKKILDHIQMGDVYELNYCMEFFDDDAEINPGKIYEKLSVLAQAPMSCFYKSDNNYLMCASPERFMKREGSKLISQPIKGTIRRGGGSSGGSSSSSSSGSNPKLAVGNLDLTAETSNFLPPDAGPISNFENDEQLKSKLYNDEKERAENVMIVDLVRNDLSRVAEKGSVAVDELFGIYTFKTVHQMISTISCRVRKEVTFTDILKALFPMGSMTGAPKIRAMQLIEDYEDAKRGLFSGSVGYVNPEGDFDFNVVIRSIFYNEESHYLSTWAGSAITIKSDPEKEYDECMLKLQAMVKALQ